MGASRSCSAAWKGHAEERAALLWHPHLTCRPSALKTQILRSDRQSEEQVWHLRVHLGWNQWEAAQTDTLPYRIMQRRACFWQWVVRQSKTIINKCFWIKHTCLIARRERTGSITARPRSPQPSHAPAPLKWCHFPSPACTDYCFIIFVQEQRGFVF